MIDAKGDPMRQDWMSRYSDNIKDYERMGYNFPVQSMASDINLLCMLKLYKMKEEYSGVLVNKANGVQYISCYELTYHQDS